MRASLAIALACGCGRIGFDARGMDAARDTVADAIPQAPLFVQANASTMVTGTLASPVASGDLVIAAIDYGTSSIVVTGVTDSLGSTYQLLGPYDGSGFRQYIAYALAAASGTDTITVAAPGATIIELRMHEYAGVSALQPLDAAGSTFGTATGADAARSPMIGTTEANELVFGVIIDGNVQAGTGFTLRGNDFGDVTEDRIASTPGAYAAIATPSSMWIATVAVFRGR